MGKLITKKSIIKIVKNELEYVSKDDLKHVLDTYKIKYNKNFDKSSLCNLIEQEIPLWNVFMALKEKNFGIHPKQLEELLNINKTIRKKLEKEKIINISYYKSNRAYGKYINTPFYDLESLYNLTKEKLDKWINKNYRKPSEKQKEGFKKASITREKNNEKKYMIASLKNAIYWREKFESLLNDKYLILDTETTGIDGEDEIIDIAIIDMQGNILLDTFVNTNQEIKESAYYVHGINKEMINNAPYFKEINDNVKKIIENKTLLIFNDGFDVRMLRQSGYNNEINSKCLMNLYMSYANSERWISLQNAMEYEELDIIQNHRALSDCLCCLKLIKKIIENSNNLIESFN